MIKIISGGQTGADLAGLWVAKKLGFRTGGVAPNCFITEVGSKPTLKALFGLTDHGSYKTRTIKNVRDADLTIIFAKNVSSPGTVLTVNSCLKYVKPYVLIKDERGFDESIENFWLTPERSGAWVRAKKMIDSASDDELADNFIINVAGNASRKAPENFEFTFVGLWLMLCNQAPINPNLSISEIYKMASTLKDRYEG